MFSHSRLPCSPDTRRSLRGQQSAGLDDGETAMMQKPMKPDSPEVDKAEKEVGSVLEKLEAETGDDVKDIGLEDMVDTDPRTGAPVVKKAVDIKTVSKPVKRWST
jgi:hypothetical protein